MVDDKDNESPDPWAGIDAGNAAEPADDFSFSFDAEPEKTAADAEGLFANVDDASAGEIDIAGVFEESLAEPAAESPAIDFPVEPEPEAEPEVEPDSEPDLEPDPLAAFGGLDAEELPTQDDLAAAESGLVDDGLLDDKLVDEWLVEEPAADAADELPLAVFPGADLHDDDQDRDAEHENSGSMVQSSAIEIGTGRSGIVSPSDVIPIDEWEVDEPNSSGGLPDLAADPSAEVPSAGESSVAGAFNFGAEEGEESVVASGSDVFPFATDDGAAEASEREDVVPMFGGIEESMPDFGEDAPIGVESAAQPDTLGDEALGDDGLGGALVAAGAGALAASAEPAAPAKKRPKAAKTAKSQGGGIGQIIGIVLGGLMALPITYAILVWGFQKDPFKFTKMVPPEVAFLLPEKFQPGFKKPAANDGPKLDQAASLDALPAEPAAVEPPAVDPAADDALAAVRADAPAEPAAAVEKPAAPADDLFAEPPAAKEPPVAAVPEPEPLDFTGLEAAIANADAAFDELAGVADPDAPGRKKLLVGWYKNLAAVAEQMVLLETAAADSGRPLDKPPQQLDAVVGRIIGSDTAVDDIGRLSGMWLTSKKRPADGAVVVATFNGARQVGPYWSSSITIEATEPKTVAVISRREPAAAAGERVLVTGVLFDGDVLWASDCRGLQKTAPVEDLF